MEILLAEDDAAVRGALEALLVDAGYAVRAARDGEEALRLFRARRPDLLLLDVRMPKRSGYAVCAAVRAEDPDVPIVFLTAYDDAESELRGLELRADDYVSKTAPAAVLLARLAGLLRRRTKGGGDFVFGPYRVDAAGGRLVPAVGAPISVSLQAVEILRWFAAHPGETASRDFLLTRFWGREAAADENALSIFFSRLRAKLGAQGGLIETAYGRGYRYAPHVSDGTGASENAHPR